MGASKSDWKAVARILDMMKYICRNGKTSMSKLADIYDVSVRTIKRDVDVLGELIPVDIGMGRYGGVYVIGDYKWDRAYMSAEDIALLIKIKEIGINKKKLILEKDDMDRLDRIIQTYTVPSKT